MRVHSTHSIADEKQFGLLVENVCDRGLRFQQNSRTLLASFFDPVKFGNTWCLVSRPP